jgi:glycosyltransferase involved in cell wall biosynthesis
MLQRIVMSPTIGRALVNFERATLVGVEQRVAALADSIVLLSSEDARVMKSELPGSVRADIVVIPPPSPPLQDVRPLEPPIRFVFIGSEALTQNRMTIRYLTDLWRRREIATPLLFVGYRLQDTPLPPNVAAPGYVDSISDIYDGRSVLLTPSFIGGGIKTKILEAFAHGAAVIGNPLTFESMEIGDYPLNITDEAVLIDLISHPESHMDAFQRAAAFGADYIRRRHDPTAFADRWRKIMQIRPAASPVTRQSLTSAP